MVKTTHQKAGISFLPNIKTVQNGGKRIQHSNFTKHNLYIDYFL